MKLVVRDRSPCDSPNNGTIAPMVEQWTENSCVAGSSPACATNTPIDKLVKSLSSKGSILKDIRVRISVGVPKVDSNSNICYSIYMGH